MKKQLSKKSIEELRKLYVPGTRIKLEKMEDTQAPPIGTIGKVICVDDIGTIHVQWQNGSSLGVVLKEDKIEIIK